MKNLNQKKTKLIRCDSKFTVCGTVERQLVCSRSDLTVAWRSRQLAQGGAMESQMTEGTPIAHTTVSVGRFIPYV